MPSAAPVSLHRPGRYRGRSFIAFVLAPAFPLKQWLEELNQWSRSSPGFFTGRAVILDLSAVTLSRAEISSLVAALAEQGVRIVGIEGAPPDELGPDLPPPLTGGRPTAQGEGYPPRKSAEPEPRPEQRSLILTSPVRSGQSVTFPYGDVTVVGHIQSGAEVIAGGSIHVYGTLRGRAIAGCMGHAGARIFCMKNEAELIAIDGYYSSTEDMDPRLKNRPVQVLLVNGELAVEVMD